jgi:hypothetical protein
MFTSIVQAFNTADGKDDWFTSGANAHTDLEHAAADVPDNKASTAREKMVIRYLRQGWFIAIHRASAHIEEDSSI